MALQFLPLIVAISIHAPRVGSDTAWPGRRSGPSHFNPRSPCGERRLDAISSNRWSVFQSTLPVWGATFLVVLSFVKQPHFNPRSPCGERLGQEAVAVEIDGISIHAPRVGSDVSDAEQAVEDAQFQSTLPVWGATMHF